MNASFYHNTVAMLERSPHVKWTMPLIVLLFACCFKQKDDIPPENENPAPTRTFDWPKIADSAINTLNFYFWNVSGNYFTLERNGNNFNGNYWPNAHALDVLLDQYLRKGKDPVIKQQMDKLVEGLRIANNNSYINYYFDDMEWMMLASLRTYQATNDQRYKDIVDLLWADVKTAWDEVSGGGFYWRKDRTNKNTPANAPACILAARLYRLNNNNADLDWAKKTYAWLKTHMIKSNGDVWDGISSFNPVSYDTRLFTYNYGTVIGSALELFLITGDQQYKNDAIKVATAAVSALTRDGILQPGDNFDGGLFNGIFVRYLLLLIKDGSLDVQLKSDLVKMLQRNAGSMWQKGTIYPECLIGPDWKNRPSEVKLTPQLSGIMLAEVMAELKKMGLL